MGADSIMDKKAYGTAGKRVMENLRFNAPNDLADKICNFNRN